VQCGLRFIVCRLLLAPWLYATVLHFLHDSSNWSSPSFSSTIFQNENIYDVFCEVSKFQHHTKLCSICSISPVFSVKFQSNLLVESLLVECRLCHVNPGYNFKYLRADVNYTYITKHVDSFCSLLLNISQRAVSFLKTFCTRSSVTTAMVSEDFTECFLLKQPVYYLDKLQASGSQFSSFSAPGGNSYIHAIDVFDVYALQTSLYCLVPVTVLSPLSSSFSVAQFVDHKIDIPQPISLYSWTRYNRS
jgi:hypothetical protein